jgi:hypothetical protein
MFSILGGESGLQARPLFKTRLRLLSRRMTQVNLKQFLKFSPFSILFLAVTGLSSCNLCKDEVVEKVVSPDGKWVATIATRDCGATTSEYIGVNLQDAKQKRLEEENYVFVIKHLHPLHVFWEGNDSLTVDCENCDLDKAANKLGKLGPVQIIYR